MAITFVQDHSISADKASSSSALGLSLSTIVPAGNLIVARLVFDNAATVGKPTVTSINRMSGETNNWVFLGAIRHPSSTSAGAFAGGEIWCIRTTVDWAATSYTVTFDTAITQKTGYFSEFSGADAALRSTTGTGYSLTTTSTSATTTGTAPVVGDLALGLMFRSNSASAQSGDVDSTGGSWSAAVGFGTTGGSAATNNFGVGQYKIVTSTAHQQYASPAASTAGNGAIVAILQQVAPASLTQAAYGLYDDGTSTGSNALAAQNTAASVEVGGGDAAGAIRVRMQSTTAVDVSSGDDHQLQWEKNASGSWANVAAAVADGSDSITNGQQIGRTTDIRVGQSFMGNGQPLRAVRFRLSKSGVPTLPLTATLYAHSGTYGSGAVPTGSPLATSTTSMPASDVVASTWYYFDFDGTYTLGNGTAYFIVLNLGLHTTNDFISMFGNTTASTHAGNSATYVSSWVTGTNDIGFRVYAYADTETVLSYDNPNLTSGGATTARLGAGTGSFVAGKVSITGAVPDFGWTANNYTELLFSYRLTSAQLANSDVLRFRVLRNGATTGQTYTQTPTINVVKSAFAVTQAAYQFFAEGTESGSTALASQDTAPAIDVTSADVPAQLRVRLQSTTSAGPSIFDDWRLQWEKNSSGSWTDVSLTSASVAAYASANLTDDANTFTRLSGGTGTYNVGRVSEDGLTENVGWAGNNHVEMLYSILLKQAGLNNGDTLRFRILRNGVTTGLTYTQVPTVSVLKTVPNWAGTIASDWGTWTGTSSGIVAVNRPGTVASSWGTSTGVAVAKVGHSATVAQSWDTWVSTTLATVHMPVPQNVVATGTGPSTIQVTWNAVSSATGYDIERDGSVLVLNHPASPFNDSGLASATEYDYRVRARRVLFNNPSDIADLILWLEADNITGLSDGAAVLAWPDLGPNDDDAVTASGTAASWQTGELNGFPIVRFASVGNALSGTLTARFTDQGTLFSVVTQDIITNRHYIDFGVVGTARVVLRTADAYVRSNGNVLSTANNSLNGTTAFAISTMRFQNGTPGVNHWKNGTSATTGGVFTAESYLGINDYALNENGGSHGSFDAAAFIAYNRALTTSELNQVGNYLAAKYGLTWTDIT